MERVDRCAAMAPSMRKTERANERRKGPRGERDRVIVRDLVAWFEAAKRDLPWRRSIDAGDDRTEPFAARRDPYHALVAEVMAQQTQIARVVKYFERFVRRFPTMEALARARESAVLEAWSGLGYYRRARHLHQAARSVVDAHDGRLPSEAAALQELPGLGRYSAGAIASIVFGRPEAIVDGNVRRVLMRLEGYRARGPVGGGDRWAWRRAEALVGACVESGESIGDWNEGLMELGATVCTPMAPRCEGCPLAGSCRARAMGLQERIPTPRRAGATRVMHAAAVVVTRGTGLRTRVMVEQRPKSGLWASMWQVPTLERLAAKGSGVWTREEIARALGIAGELRRVGGFVHQTSHREVRFVVWRAEGAENRGHRRWASLAWVRKAAMSNAQRRVLEVAGWMP